MAARLADPDAILYYNDYNTDNSGRANLIRDMVVDVNNRYLALPDAQKPDGERTGQENEGRLLIEGIGMQEHHNLGVSANSIRTTITKFRNMTFTGSSRKIRLSVSELDVIAFPSYSAFSTAGGQGAGKDQNSSAPKDSALITQANLYGDYMKLYIANADIIERVSLWGITDDTSWRSVGRPLLFDRHGMTKPAYYKFVGALP